MSKADRDEGRTSPKSKPQELRLASDSDGSLVGKAVEGDTEAFELLAMRHRRRILSLALRITGDFQDAEDIVQQVLLKVFVNLSKFRGTAQFSTWLSRITINEALMLKRKTRSCSRIPLSNDEDDGFSMLDILRAPGLSPEDAVSQGQWRSIVTAAISQLSAKSRDALRLREIQEHSIAETASVLGVSIPAAKTRVARGRQVLRQRLERHWKTRPLADRQEVRLVQTSHRS